MIKQAHDRLKVRAVRAFAYFGGVPRQTLYDNTKLAVAKILGGGERKKTRAFSELQSHYLFEEKFGRPGKGNDKGKVEGLVGYARRNFMVPIPRVGSWEELNTHLLEQCGKRRERRLRGQEETIGERFERDRTALLPLPDCRRRPINSLTSFSPGSMAANLAPCAAMLCRQTTMWPMRRLIPALLIRPKSRSWLSM